VYDGCVCFQQGKAVQQAYMDIYKLFGPLFNGIADDVLGCEARIESKARPILHKPRACTSLQFCCLHQAATQESSQSDWA